MRSILHAGQRLLRYYACAVSEALRVIPVAQDPIFEQAVRLGHWIADDPRFASGPIVCDYRNLITRIGDSRGEARATAINVARLCVNHHIHPDQFAMIHRAVEDLLGKGFDDHVYDCIRPTTPRLSSGTGRPDIRAMAFRIHDEGDWSACEPLSDAIEEAGIFTQEHLEHLRDHPHWRGCWVIDEVLGFWGG